MTTLDGVERTLTRRRPPDLRRRARRRRASPGSWAARRPRSPTPRPRSCSSRRTSSASGIAKTSKRLGLRSEASARFERGIDPERRRHAARRARWSCSARSRRRGRVAGAIDVYPKPIERRAHHRAHRRGSTSCSAPTLDRRRDRGATSRRSASRSTTASRVGADVPARPRARDRPRRGGRAAGSGSQQHRAHGAVEPREDRRAHARAARAPRGRRRARRRRLRRGRTRCRCSRRPTSRAPASPPDAVDRGREPTARRGVDPAARAAARACCARSRTTPRTATPDVALFEIGTVFAPPGAGETLPAERVHLAVARVGTGACARRTSPTATSTVYDAIAVRRGARAGAAPRRLAARGRARAAASTRRAPRASSSTAPRSASVGEIDGRRGRRARRCRPGRRVRARRRRAARGARARPRARGRSRGSRRRRSTSRSSSPTTVPAGAVLRTLARRGRRAARAGRALRRVPLRRARRRAR